MKSDGKTKFFWLVILFVLVVGPACQNEPEAGPTAPDFRLPDLSGRVMTLTEYRGRVVVVDFWATWCPPCRMSIPELVKLQKKYGNEYLVILGISMDDPGLYPNAVLQDFKEKFKINYPILRSTDHVVQQYFGPGPPAIPTLFVVDREGRVKDKIVGFNPEALQRSVDRLIE